jgi:two-component system sensor histidine kinase PhoQ
MDRAVAYQLQRAKASSHSALALARALTPQAERLLSALRKVHADKAVAVDLIIAPDLHTRLDEGELSEVLGNLLDNAFKWCQGRVSLSADRHEPDTLWLEVSDDGPGFDADIGQRVLERGVRADEQIPGHGIGLSIVRELVSAREGHIVLGRSSLGGASVQVTLPGTAVHGSAR